MKNIQVSFDENTIAVLDKIAEQSNATRTAVIREAVKAWLKQKKIAEFESGWIEAMENRNLPKTVMPGSPLKRGIVLSRGNPLGLVPVWVRVIGLQRRAGHNMTDQAPPVYNNSSLNYKLVQAWLEIHNDEIMADWKLASEGNEIFKIDPLK